MGPRSYAASLLASGSGEFSRASSSTLATVFEPRADGGEAEEGFDPGPAAA
jgi:hypothetical protein